MLLAIETSCDESAAAIFDMPAKPGPYRDSLLAEVVSSQIKLHAAYGGVVPELAAREHLKNLPLVVEEVFKLAQVQAEKISHVAVTYGPGLNICLMIGLAFAKTFAKSVGAQLLPINHLEGHLRAIHLEYEASRASYPRLYLLVSGGHTALILESKFRVYDLIAQTRDDAAGEAFDKAGTLLGLEFPGGPQISKLAELGNAAKVPLPIGVKADPTSFSFSGLKTALRREIEIRGSLTGQDQADLAAALQAAIVTALLNKTEQALRKYHPRQVILTGGVAANPSLRAGLELLAGQQLAQFIVPSRQWCTDNAAMIGACALDLLAAGQTFPDFSVGPTPSLALEFIQPSAR
ncbi:tRNA (adenosine(37)-N6)-threonylcarbamoyltransferase complex transferase subunit TsaD [bacterium]|nr:tRNA (adenosine(37)-N6)-threonylcarbamoyltransferase complex transferase subunit TsaD [bacterium]